IPPYVEGLPCVNQVEQGRILGLGANVEISSIEPPPDIQSWNMLSRRVRGVRGGTLRIQVEMLMINRGLERIVKMRDTVPHTVGFAHEHMVHLYGEEDVKGG